jgi:diguanylate cyclase (GGDEF)-like protein
VTYVFSRFEQLKASGALPSPNGVALEILRLSQSEDATVAQLAHVLHADPALSGRLVKFANSTQGGTTRPVVAISDAVKLLGFAVVRQLCLGFSVLNANRSGGCAGFDYVRYWSRSLATALAAQLLCIRVRVLAPEESFTCGLLSDIGSLALASLYPERFSEVLATGATGPNRSAAEREAFGADHLEFGAALLEDWRLPKICVDAVFHSEMPEQTGFDPSSRPQMLCELMSLSRRIGEYFVADLDARKRIAPVMLLRAARIGVDAEVLAQLCDAVGEGWQRWGGLLGVATGKVPKLERCPATEPIDIARDPLTAAAAAAGAQAGRAVPAADPGAATGKGMAGIAAGTGSATASADRRQPPGLRIHVVSDDRFSGGRLRDLLAGAGHAVAAFAAPDAALAAALADPPDMIVIDLHAGQADAAGLCASLRATSIGRRMYILGTLVPHPDAGRLADPAGSLDAEPVSGSDAGPDDYLHKPVDSGRLELRVRAARRVLVLREALQREQDDLRRLAAELATANRRLQRSALTDALTGLPNRRYAFERLEQEWATATRNHRPLSYMAIDVDHFRRVNALAGQAAGDKALSMVAAILRESARASDVICRVGGEEFVVICPDADGAAAMKAAGRLRAVAEQRLGREGLFPRSGEGPLTLSIGVATRDESVCNPESLVRLAEAALEAAQKAGRNRVHLAMTVLAPAAGVAPEAAAS